MSEEEIRAIIRGTLGDGGLPSGKGRITWSGPGRGHTRIACDAAIASPDVECACEHPDGGVRRFHRRGFAGWDEMRQVFA